MTPKILHFVAMALAERPMYTRSRFFFVAGVALANVLAARAFCFTKPTYGDSAVLVLFGIVGFLLPSSMLAMIQMGYKDYNKDHIKDLVQSGARLKAIIQTCLLYAHATWLTIIFLFSIVWLLLVLIAPYLEPASC